MKRKEGMLMNRKHGHQMSDSLIIMILLNLSGGTQDACSYFLRDHVFANAQTGNIVLMGCYLISEDLRDSIRYFLPVFCFALGVLTACFIRSKCRHTGKIHWRHLVLDHGNPAALCGRFSAATGKHGWQTRLPPLPVPCRCSPSARLAAAPMPAPCVSAICEVVWIISTGL